MRPDLDRDGAALVEGAAGAEAVGALRALAPASAGARLTSGPALGELLDPKGAVGRIAAARLPGARPVRAVLFDTTAGRNWAVAWHQDRTIAVQRRIETEGFGPWSVKAGIVHVEPPFAVLEGMLTLRVHLDDCSEDNAPLMVARGSHRFGRVPAGDADRMARGCDHLVCLAAAGDVWVYRTPVLHASERARRPGRRRVLQVDYAAGALPGGLIWRGIDDAEAACGGQAGQPVARSRS